MNIILSLSLLLLLIISVRVTNYDLIHPAVIFSVLWFVPSFMYMLMAEQWQEPCSSETCMFILGFNLLCVLFMLIFSKLNFVFMQRNRYPIMTIDKVNFSSKLKLSTTRKCFIFVLLIVFYIVTTNMMLSRIDELAAMASRYNLATNAFYLARISEINGEGFGQLYINIMRLNIAMGIVLAKRVADMIANKQKGYMLFTPFLIYAVLFSVIRGSRNDMMYLLGAYMFILVYYLYRNRNSNIKNAKKAFKYLVAFMIIIVGVWGISGIFFSRVGNSAISSIIGYVGGPIAGFNELLYHPDLIQSNYFGQNTFDSIYVMLDRLGFIYFELGSVYLPYTVSSTFSINVYTMYGRYFADFGLFGTFILTSMFGAFYGLVYGELKRAYGRRKEHVIVLIYSACMYPLIMSFFEDKFYSYINNTILLIIFVITIDKIVISRLFKWVRLSD